MIYSISLVARKGKHNVTYEYEPKSLLNKELLIQEYLEIFNWIRLRTEILLETDLAHSRYRWIKTEHVKTIFKPYVAEMLTKDKEDKNNNSLDMDKNHPTLNVSEAKVWYCPSNISNNSNSNSISSVSNTNPLTSRAGLSKGLVGLLNTQIFLHVRSLILVGVQVIVTIVQHL